MFAEQEFAKNIMRAAETAKSSVSQQVSFGLGLYLRFILPPWDLNAPRRPYIAMTSG